MSISFRGRLEPDVVADIREVYSRTSPLFTSFLVLVGVVLLALALRPASRFSLPDRVPEGGLALFSFAFAVLTQVYPRIGWRTWWEQFSQEFGADVSGEISEEGLRWQGVDALLPWSRFYDVKKGERTLLLYFNRYEALPFHRTWFKDEGDWKTFVKIVRRLGPRVV